jgi:hypothetical protein
MRRPEYYTSPLFLTGVGLVAIISLLMVAATLLLGEAKCQSSFSQKLASQEKEMIESALRESEGRVFGPSGAAAKLGISRSTVESKIRSLRINKNRFKSRAGMPAGRSWFESVSITPLRANGAA